ncbi:hypothetical protein P9139_04600 [Curtobacterium flaccumfaciens]|nr:hypothetical protein P9139_04600 [Curtobacterium flaccumfaciens]
MNNTDATYGSVVNMPTIVSTPAVVKDNVAITARTATSVAGIHTDPTCVSASARHFSHRTMSVIG